MSKEENTKELSDNKALHIAGVRVRVSFIRLHSEYFNIKWLFRYGFWRIILFGIIAKFGYITVNKKPVDGIYISYGSATPLQELWDQGYEVRLIGKIFNECILEYRLN